MKIARSITRISPYWIFVLVVLVTTGISVQKYLLPPRLFFGEYHTAYNNYLIFKYSLAHLLSESPLYVYYPSEYGDLYKYSPTFALFMAPFALLPDLPGLILWNLLNSISLLYILYKIVEKNRHAFLLISSFIFLELLTSLHNAQSNALVTALVLAFVSLHSRGRIHLAALCLALSVYIKLFGGLALLLLPFMPGQGLKSLLSFLMWMLILLILPLLIVSPQYMLEQYAAWLHLLRTDYPHIHNLSLYSLLQSLGIPAFPSIYLSVAGLIILVLCFGVYFIKTRKTGYTVYLPVSLILMWMILFNHKSESPTYIIGITGIGLLYLISDRRLFSKIILLQSFVFISLSSTDLFPPAFREAYLYPAQVKVWGLLPAFLWALYLHFKAAPLRSPAGTPPAYGQSRA